MFLPTGPIWTERSLSISTAKLSALSWRLFIDSISAVSSSSGVCRYSSIIRRAFGGIFLAHQNHSPTHAGKNVLLCVERSDDQSQCPRIRASRALPWLLIPVRYQTRAPVSHSDSDAASPDVEAESAIVTSDQDDLLDDQCPHIPGRVFLILTPPTQGWGHIRR